MLTRVSNGLVGLHVVHYGRGPTRARTIMQGDFLVCFLEDVYTVGERTLIDAGQFALVRAARLSVQEAHAARMVEVVEQATGRAVLGVASQVMVDPDMSIEAFALGPAG